MSEFYIVFIDMESNNKFLKFLKFCLRKGFSHCFVLFRDGYGGWVMVNPCFDRLDVSVLPHSSKRQPKNFLNNYTKIVKYKTNKTHQKKVCYIGFYHCVSIVSKVIGFDKFCFTPYGLYKALQKGV